MFRQAVEHLKAAATDDTHRVYARILCLQGYFSEGDERKQERYQQSLSIFEKLDEKGQDIRYERAAVLFFLGQVAQLSDPNDAMKFFQKSLRLFQDLNNRYWQAEVLHGIGLAKIYTGNLDEAQKNLERGLDISQELGDPRKIGLALNKLDYIARNRGDFEEAERLARQSLAIYETSGASSAMADGIANLGIV